MNESDTVKILRRDALAAADEGATERGRTEGAGEPSTSFLRPPCTVKCSALTVEPVIFLAMFSVAMNGPLSTQYLWDRISQDVGYNGSRASECTNGSAPPDPLQKVCLNHWGRSFKYSLTEQKKPRLLFDIVSKCHLPAL